jgi:hypothetical protein
MANEIPVDHTTGKRLYAQVRNAVGQIWNTATPAFETYATANVTDYDVALTEEGTASGYYTGDMPAVPLGVYNVVVKEQPGASPAETDRTIAVGAIEWTGTAVTSVASRLAPATPGNTLNVAGGVADADAVKVATSAAAATSLKNTALATLGGLVATNGGANTATVFKTDLTAGTDDYFGDGTGGGAVLVFVAGATNAYQARRIASYNHTTKVVTVEEAFAAVPADNDAFVVLGRIEA